MKLYLAGKITGNPDYREQFAQAANKLRAEGHDVLNPADNPDQPSWSAYMKLGIGQLVTCDGIALLPNWAESPGATKEHAIAGWLGMPITFL